MKTLIITKYFGKSVDGGVRVGRKTQYASSLITRYFRLVLWIFGVSNQVPYLVLAKRIEDLKSHNGVKFVTEFLKESVRLVQHWKSGNPTTCIPTGVRVASRRGLPLILPGSLRLQLESGDPTVVRVVLTLLSIFRIFKYPGSIKLSTITEPFYGITDVVNKIEAERV